MINKLSNKYPQYFSFCSFEEMDDPFGDLDEGVPGDEVDAVRLTGRRVLRRPKHLYVSNLPGMGEVKKQNRYHLACGSVTNTARTVTVTYNITGGQKSFTTHSNRPIMLQW